ncbi:MAG: endonuclease/exonuclease/phosphatase family protein [Acidimicrobiales bacterium]
MQISFVSLNCENMADLAPRTGTPRQSLIERSRLLGALIKQIDADVVGLVEAAVTRDRTQQWLDNYVDGAYEVHQGESRGLLGLAVAVRRSLELTVDVVPKAQCNRLYALEHFDADNDGIREVYTWANRVPHEVVLAGARLVAPVTVIVVHAKSKGVFIPGDLFAYEQLSRAARMKLRAQAAAVRARLDRLVDDAGRGRVVVMGDLNDSAEFDIYAAKIGGAFLIPVMGSVWDPVRIFRNVHADVAQKERWTIDFQDRVVNPMTESRYGMPTAMRQWIDHILVSPELAAAVVPGTAVIHHQQPVPAGWTGTRPRGRGTDHHPPSVTLEL